MRREDQRKGWLARGEESNATEKERRKEKRKRRGEKSEETTL